MTSRTVEQKKVTMHYQDSEAIPAPRYDEAVPQFETLLSSEGRGWKNIQVYTHKLAAQPELVVTPIVDAHSIPLMLQGHGEIRGVLDGRNVHGQLYPGSAGLMPNGVPASYRWTHPIVVAHVYLSPNLTQMTQDFNSSNLEHLEFIPTPFFDDPLIEQLCLALVHELESDGLHGSLYADTMALALTVHLLRHYSSLSRVNDIHARGLSKQQLHRVHEFIGDFLAADVGLDELANLTGLSAASFAKQFKISTGLPPHQYLILRRVERAKELLRGKVLTVAEVSQAVGFFDQSHLIRHFKHWVGVTPKDYRESNNPS
jgi:AraC family transcriptional regulator